MVKSRIEAEHPHILVDESTAVKNDGNSQNHNKYLFL